MEIKCDGCLKEFGPLELLKFEGNVSSPKGGGFIGNNLVSCVCSEQELAPLWIASGDLDMRLALSRLVSGPGRGELTVVVSSLHYCKGCTLRIINGAFDMMRHSDFKPTASAVHPLENK